MHSVASMYQAESVANCTTEQANNERIKLCVFGMTGELGEVVEPLKKHIFRGKRLNKRALALEVGDVLYYLTVLADELGYSLEQIMQMNMDKLRKRRAAAKRPRLRSVK